MIRCQGTPWSEELDGKELHEAAGGDYDPEPRGSVFFCSRSQHNPYKHRQMWYNAGLKWMAFLHDPLHS